MFNKKCKTCEALKEQNSYLKKIIDRLLAKSGMAPITETPPITAEEDDKFEKIVEGGGQVFGD